MPPLPRLFLSTAFLFSIAGSLRAQLNGSYTVGAAGNYTTIAAAITALQTNGVSGPVTMNIISGSYSGNWTINAIAGTSSVNTVTVQSQTMSAAAVTLSNTAASPMLTFSNCTFVRLRYVTANTTNYGVVFQNAASDITVSNCIFSAGATAGVNSAAVFTGSRITLENNAFLAGQFAIRLNNSGVSYGADMIVRDNTISGVTNDGIMVDRADGLSVERNTISSTGANTATYNDGISVRNCINELLIARNTVNWGVGTTGIYVDVHTPMVGSPPVIENNMVVITAGTAAGSALSVLTTNNVVIRHNSLRCTMNKYTMQVQFCTNVVAEGNIHQTMAAECVLLQSATFASIDRNIYYCTQANMARQTPATYYTWAAWQALGRDANSLFMDPLFVSATDLHIQAGSPAISMAPTPALTPVDRDGGARPLPVGTTPDIGAHERPDGCTGMSGTYTIGPGAGNNYMSFGHAVLAMSNCSIIGPVTFLVQSGTYIEQVSLPQISGTSSTNTITFRSAALDSSAVVLTWPSSATNTNDFTVRMNGADHVTFDRITIERPGTASYAHLIVFNSTTGSAGSQFTRIRRCRLRGATNAGISGTLISSAANGHEDSLLVESTRFVNGRVGIQWQTAADNDLLLVQDNIFEGQQSLVVSLSIRDRAFTVRRNSMTITTATGTGMSIGTSTAGFDVSGNRISSNYYAISLPGGISTALGGEPRLYNNTLRTNGVAMIIWGASNSGLRIDNNSISSTSYAIHLNGTMTIASLRNNALASNSIPFYRQTATATVTLASHNALYTAAVGPIAFWTANQNTIAALQSTSGQFANSFIANPLYYDAPNNDLHAYAMELDAAGTAITYITNDNDADPRNATIPDVGADEFQPQLWADAFNTCGAADPITSTGAGTDQWIYKDRKVLARFNDNGQNLGTVQLNVFLNNGPVRQSLMAQYYMDRNWNLATQNAISGSVSMRLFFSGAEFATYAAADPLVNTTAEAGVAHYSGVNENCSEVDDPAGQTWITLYPVSNGTEPRIAATGGALWVTPTLGNDGELYITAHGQPLPVELIAFGGERIDAQHVRLYWSTATEHDNHGFEVWRMIEGEEEFQHVGWVDGAGDSQQAMHYVFTDPNPASRTSYYRLRQVDIDGASEDSQVIAVAGTTLGNGFTVFPNPADRVVYVNVDREQVSVIILLDASGRPARSWMALEDLRLDGIAAGVHLLQVHLLNGCVQQQRLVVR